MPRRLPDCKFGKVSTQQTSKGGIGVHFRDQQGSVFISRSAANVTGECGVSGVTDECGVSGVTELALRAHSSSRPPPSLTLHTPTITDVPPPVTINASMRYDNYDVLICNIPMMTYRQLQLTANALVQTDVVGAASGATPQDARVAHLPPTSRVARGTC